LGNGHPVKAANADEEIRRILSGGLKLMRIGGGGEISRFVCGYMICDPGLSGMFLHGLPSMFKVNIREDGSGQWLENAIRYSVAAVENGAGSEAVLAKLCETLFIETLRRYIGHRPEGDTGWIAGARNPELGKALALIHERPAERWTVASLAHKSGLSRSVLAERFQQYLGEPPVAYLTRWRLHLGAQMLLSTTSNIAQIAAHVGYDSEQAFNRAFKRAFGAPPARYRNEMRSQL
jgi:AraC-like DNA-binding protein